MNKLIFSAITAMLIATPAFAFDTGKWESKYEDRIGNIEVKKQGNNYVTTLNIYEPSRPGFDAGYCLEDAKSKSDGAMLQVLTDDNRIAFTIMQSDDDIMVMPNVSVLLEAGHESLVCGDDPMLDEKDFALMQWKKSK